MWAVQSITSSSSGQVFAFSDGQPINAVRGPEGSCYRLLVGEQGFIDFTDMGHQPNGPAYWQVIIGGQPFWYEGQGAIDLDIKGNSCVVTGDGNNFTISIVPYILPSQNDIDIFNEMVQNNYIPYQNIPDEPGKTPQQLEELGQQYFGYSSSSDQLATAIYDWTTADFTRIDFMLLFAYTGLGVSAQDNPPLDLDSIANGIWTSNWGTYTPSNADYMNSFMMVPASSLSDVQSQLNNVYPQLQKGVIAESNVIYAALMGMPRTSTFSKPKLYSGQVAIANLGLDHFATYFNQMPANSDPSKPRLQMDLSDALSGFMSVGNQVTFKSFMSFTDSESDAMHYSNGIVVIVSPPDGAYFWKDATYITPLSDGPDKTEYLFHPGTQFRVDDIQTVNEGGKDIVQISMTIVDG